MSDRYYSDVDEDDYFDEPEYNQTNSGAEDDNETQIKTPVHNPRKNIKKELPKSDYTRELKSLLPSSSKDIEAEEDDDKSIKAKKKMQVERFSGDDYDRRSSQMPQAKSTNEKIAEEEHLVRAKLDKLIQKRQEKLLEFERKINIMSVYQNLRFFVRVLFIKRIKNFEDKFFYTSKKSNYLEIVSHFDIGKYYEDFKTVSMEEKLDAVLTLMVQSKNKQLLKKYSATQIFIVLLGLFGVRFWLNHYLTLEGVELQKRFQLRIARDNKSKRPSTKAPKGKKVMNSIDTQISALVLNMISELNDHSIQLQISDGVKVFDYHKLAENNKTAILIGLKGKFFFGVYRFDKSDHEDHIGVSHVSVLELEEDMWVRTMLNTTNIGLKPTVDEVTRNNNSLSIRDQKLMLALRKSRIPQSPYEFKVNEFYTIKIVLRRGEMIKDHAKPTDFQFMDDPVYYKTDVIELCGKIKWKMKGRQVRPDEKPIKIMPNIYKSDQLMELYAEWQTDPFVFEMKDGKLPENEFGNIELFGCPLPPELVHLNYKSIWKACKQLEVDYRHAVTGFDLRKGRMFAVKSGVVIFKEHEVKVMNAWKVMEKEILEKEKSKRLEGTLKKWKMIFKTLLVKKYMSRNYKV